MSARKSMNYTNSYNLVYVGSRIVKLKFLVDFTA
jgi:hypothetical protein